MFLFWLRQFPQCWDWTPASLSPPTEGRSSPTNTLIFSPRCFILPSLACFCIFFSSGQVLLFTLSWFPTCTSVSEDVFLMYPWREVYSMSTYSSTILFSPPVYFLVGRLCITVMRSSGYRAFPLQTWWFVYMAEVLVNYPTEWDRFFSHLRYMYPSLPYLSICLLSAQYVFILSMYA